MNKIKYTDRGFNYVEVSPYENLSWGGCCICNSCGGQFVFDNMYLVFVLGDTYCKKCFNEWLVRARKYSQEDVDYDLKIQREKSFKWYKYYLPHLEDIN